MFTPSLDQSHEGFHQLDVVRGEPNPARWKAEMVVPSLSDEIAINQRRVEEVAELLAHFEFSLPEWDFPAKDRPLYPQFEGKEDLLRYFLILSSINYEYFHLGLRDPSGEALRFSDGVLSGAELATSRITEFWDRLRDVAFLRDLPTAFAEKHLFEAQVPIPRLGNRVDCLRAVGTCLSVLERNGLGLSDVFEQYQGNPLSVARHLSDWIVGFKDEYLKRAQLYAAMVAGRFQDRADNPVDMNALGDLTVIADYRVPQTLIGWGILDISDRLRDHLNRLGCIREDSVWGQGLRAGSIVAVDRFVEAVNLVRAQSDIPREPVTAIHADPVIWAVPRQYRKAIAKGDTALLKKLEGLFVPSRQVEFPQMPTILH